MKKKTSSLRVTREIIRSLTSAQLCAVDGGGTTDPTAFCPFTAQCPPPPPPTQKGAC